eukprot:6530360-Lingulodinium_polyedra.AAC.1
MLTRRAPSAVQCVLPFAICAVCSPWYGNKSGDSGKTIQSLGRESVRSQHGTREGNRLSRESRVFHAAKS